jgi:hypothetical protein
MVRPGVCSLGTQPLVVKPSGYRQSETGISVGIVDVDYVLRFRGLFVVRIALKLTNAVFKGGSLMVLRLPCP